MTREQKIIRDLFSRYRPENLPRLQYILKQYKGNEQEVIDAFCLKYGVDYAQFLQDRKSDGLGKRRRINLIILVILLMGGAFCTWFFWLRGDGVLETKYVIATSVLTRTRPDFKSKTTSAQAEKLRYGTPVDVLAYENQLAKIRWEDDQIRWIPEIYLGTRREYLEINAIFANDSLTAGKAHSSHKRALLKYFEDHKFVGEMSRRQQNELYGEGPDRQVWRVERERDSRDDYSTLVIGNFSKKIMPKRNHADTLSAPDLALILEKPRTRDRKLLAFTFDESGNSRLLMDWELPPDFYIARATGAWEFPGFPEEVKAQINRNDDILKVGVPFKSYIRQYIFLYQDGQLELYTQTFE